LLPEKAQTADVTVAYDSPTAAFSTGWFDRNGSNFIVLDPVTFVPENAQRAATAGIILTASSKPFAGLVAEASFTDLYLARNLVTGARLPRNPAGSATLSLTHPFAQERLAYGLRWGIVGSDGEDKANVSPLGSEYDAYDSLDAFVRYKFAREAIVSLRGFNLGNEAYAPVFAYPASGRRVYVELSTR
jgi:outer membrane receptor protein involved in Fe transport